MSVDLKRMRKFAWDMAAIGVWIEENNGACTCPECGCEMEENRDWYSPQVTANFIRDLCDEVERIRFFYTLFRSMAEHGPAFAEALDKSARAAELWKEGLVQKISHLYEEIEKRDKKIADLCQKNQRLLKEKKIRESGGRTLL